MTEHTPEAVENDVEQGPEQKPKLDVVTYPNPILNMKAEPIAAVTEDIRQLAQDMAQTMYASEGQGLAAPQVSKLLRMVVTDTSGPSNRSDLRFFINPEIIAHEGEVESENEGCLSVIGYRANVKRAEKVTVKALDLDGNVFVCQADGMLSICLQHEIDHLDGVLFIDRISRLKRSFYEKKLQKWLKKRKSE